MASPARSPNAKLCEEKQRLTNELLDATRELVSWLDRKIADAARGGPATSAGPDAALAEARQRRHEVKEALLLHVSMHGC